MGSRKGTWSKGGLIAVIAASATVLAACGDGSTAKQDDAASSAVPTVTTTKSSSAAKPSASTNPSEDQDTSNPTDPSESVLNAEHPVEVSGAQTAGQRSEAESKFVAQLKQDKIDMPKDVADQVIASGHEYCQAKAAGRESFTVPAVAGQLIAQKITEQSESDVEKALTQAADATLCN